MTILIRMYVQESGSGSIRVYLLPGGPGLPPVLYRELIDGLSRRYRLRFVGFSGTSPETASPFPETIEDAAREVLAAIEDDDSPGKTVLLGHSYGGAVAIEALLRGFPADRAILMNAFPSGDFLAREVRERVTAMPEEFHEAYKRAGDDPAEISRLTSEFWFPRHVCRVSWPESFLTGLQMANVPFMNRVLGPSIFDPVGTVRDWNREADISSLMLPVLVIGGANDYYSPQSINSVYGALPQGTITTGLAASHTPWIEDPQATYDAIVRYIDDAALHET